ncbi:MAG: polynucleotide adenylyltransferase PcnB [Planctomycetota bacterium]|nr:MAG: polynucleotide adenylyltransferase PcnB [Planctomycetota bacterium]
MEIEQAPRRTPMPFSRRKLDRRAVDVLKRLQEAGHETYFVGGCVRDLLLGRQPKDFDLATSASPNQVRRLFRRSRIIGRRFKLVHVYAGRQVYEVATFRSAPEEAIGEEVQVIRDDNTFGTAREDALRRDFRVNGLFLDPVASEIVDWVDGLADIRNRRLSAIGDPLRRFQEDPVRILRLVKFMRRLGLEPGEAEVAAAQEVAPLLVESAPPRVVEEVFRLALTGDLAGVLEDLTALEVLHLVLPDLAGWLERGGDRFDLLVARVERLDEWIRDGGEPSYGLRLAMLYGPFVEEELRPEGRTVQARDGASVPSVVFSALQRRARLPRAVLNRATRILQAQARMDPALDFRKRRRRRSAPDWMLQQDFFAEALECLRCRLEADGRELDLYDEWHERALFMEDRPG